ncbi:UNVERIFIED_CONTAM: hypothetical protein HDU68_002227 [Siphonaria sp. JEL0065]|nr:hypothetical protein HDU68_002227 [Siphonaria sp. JEL0065]
MKTRNYEFLHNRYGPTWLIAAQAFLRWRDKLKTPSENKNLPNQPNGEGIQLLPPVKNTYTPVSKAMAAIDSTVFGSARTPGSQDFGEPPVARIFSEPPAEFIFSPSLAERPPKRQAVITSLFVAEPDVYAKKFKDAAWFFTGAYFHSYTFLKHEPTRIKNNHDIEFVVMVTELVPKGYRLALEDMGARVLLVPAIEIKGREKTPGDKYQYLYTKLNMFRLEGIYENVLFFDVDLFFLRQSPVDLFDWIPKNATYFFGSTQEWKKGYGAFNSGIQLFKPSHFHYAQLIEKASDPDFAGYGDQSLHNHYWKTGGPYPWTELPQKYNTHHLEDRNAEDIANAIGFHAKFWSECHIFSNASATVFPIFAKTSQDVRTYQMKRYASGDLDAEAVLMPYVSETCAVWTGFTKWKGGMFLKVALLSTPSTPSNILKTRDEFADLYGTQAVHLVMEQETKSTAIPLVLRQLKTVKKLFGRFDFVWVLSENVVMGSLDRTFLYDLHGHTHLTTFNDCINTRGDNVTGSFLIGKLGETKMDRVLKLFEQSTEKELTDAKVWEELSKEFTKRGGKMSLKVNGTDEYYSVQEREKACEGFLKSEIYGEKP